MLSCFCTELLVYLAAVRAALSAARVTPDGVSLVHLHAMGNPASDQFEIEGVLGFLANHNANPLVLATHKANIGHSNFAAGVLGLIASTLVLAHRIVPPTINVAAPCRSLQQMHTVILSTNKSTQLELTGQLLGCMNGTSISGDNVHIVLQHNPDHNQCSVNKCPATIWHQALDTIATCNGQSGRLDFTAADKLSLQPHSDGLDQKQMPAKQQLIELLTASTNWQPVLTKEDYSTTPPLCELRALGAEELRTVVDFKIHRANVGTIEWLVPVDIIGVNLDHVGISRNGIVVDTAQLPTLNCASRVLIEQLFPKPGASASKAMRFAQKLQVNIESLGHSFESYNKQSGVLRFQVEHFSRISIDLNKYETVGSNFSEVCHD